MSNHDNHRRGDKKRTETGPRWENRNPGKGCNATHVARARAAWKRLKARAYRRIERRLEQLSEYPSDVEWLGEPNAKTKAKIDKAMARLLKRN